MSKKLVNGYNLSIENHKWLKKQADESERSVSSFLDRLITTTREMEKKNVKTR